MSITWTSYSGTIEKVKVQEVNGAPCLLFAQGGTDRITLWMDSWQDFHKMLIRLEVEAQELERSLKVRAITEGVEAEEAEIHA